MTKTRITRDEWLTALSSVVKPCDPDAFTVTELAEKYSIGRQAVSVKMNELVSAKKAVKTWKLIGNRRLPAYKLI